MFSFKFNVIYIVRYSHFKAYLHYTFKYFCMHICTIYVAQIFVRLLAKILWQKNIDGLAAAHSKLARINIIGRPYLVDQW